MNPIHIQEDWPTDPANEELARLAQQLQAAAPPLPADALARVQQQVQAELDRAERRQRRRRVVFGWSIAAGILVALGGYAYFRAPSSAPQVVKNAAAPVLIEDRITVALGDSSARMGDKPLVRLDENRSLFTD